MQRSGVVSCVNAAARMPAYAEEGTRVTITGSQLAMLLRQTQWTLDDVARDLPTGRLTPEAREELAAMLESLVSAIRDSAGERP